MLPAIIAILALAACHRKDDKEGETSSSCDPSDPLCTVTLVPEESPAVTVDEKEIRVEPFPTEVLRQFENICSLSETFSFT